MTFEQNVQINCQLSFQFSTRSWSWQLLIFLEEERFKLWCNSFHLQSRAQNLFAKAPGHTNRIKKLVNCSAIVFMYFRNVFIRPEGRRLPWTRMAFKRQITFPKAWKPLVNYSRSSALVSCLKNDNCFGCCVPRQKSELHRSTLFLSLSHLKKTRTGDKHCKGKMHHAGVQYHWTMPVGRLILVGCSKWHLVAKARTTTSMSLTERF